MAHEVDRWLVAIKVWIIVCLHMCVHLLTNRSGKPNNVTEADKDREIEQLEEELRKLESELENNEIEHKKLQNEHELKLKELHDKREELQHAQRWVMLML